VTTHRIRVQRTARYEVLEPGGSAACTLWALHGYAQLAVSFAGELAPLVAAGVRVVAPEALSRLYLRGGAGRIGASWMTREERDDEIADYVAYLDRVRSTLESSIAPGPELVLGFSQGAATAFRWSVLGSVRPRRLVLVGGDVPPDTDWEAAVEALEGTEVVLVAGDEDPSFPRAKADASAVALGERGLTCRSVTFAGGHRLPPEPLLHELAAL